MLLVEPKFDFNQLTIQSPTSIKRLDDTFQTNNSPTNIRRLETFTESKSKNLLDDSVLNAESIYCSES